MPNGIEQAVGTADIDCLYDIAEQLVLIPNKCGLSTAEKLILDFQLENLAFSSLEL